MMQKAGDLILAYVGAGIHFAAQAVEIVHMEAYINIGVGISVIIFTLIRCFYWIKHEGFADKE